LNDGGYNVEKTAALENSQSSILGKLHDSLYDNSKSISTTDTILVGATYVFNLAMLFILFVSKEESLIFFVFLISLVIVNPLILLTFNNSRKLREKMHKRQKQIYVDLSLEKYFDDSVVHNYKTRYQIWIWLDVILGIMVILVALLGKFA
jgi:hypothetical protein